MNNQNFSIIYFQITDLWKRLCEEHSELFNLTCDEYSHLLSNSIDELETTVADKEKIVANINTLESLRHELINSLNELLKKDGITKLIKNVSELIITVQEFDLEKEQKHLFRFNKLLIDIIEKIQKQNKKNRLFINKALFSLQEMRDEASGQKSYVTYTAYGKASKITHDV